MSELTTTLELLVAAYLQAGLDCGYGLKAPATELEIRSAEKQLGRRFPAELAELYGRFGGQEYVPPGVTGLFGRYRLDSPVELVRSHRMYCDTLLADALPQFPPDEGRFHPRLLPFASFDAWSLCVDAETGWMWQFSPNHGTHDSWTLPSIGAALEELLRQARAGQKPRLFQSQRRALL